MIRRCTLCDTVLEGKEVRYASFTCLKPFCASCVDKFKQAKKQLVGMSDDEIITRFRDEELLPFQVEARKMTSEVVDLGFLGQTPESVKARPELSPQTVVDARRAGMTPADQWEYKHIVIRAAQATEAGDRATRPEIGSYPSDDIEQRLRSYGQEGWELVCMEPQWFWERVGISMAQEITRPRVITGWYCTFKRRLIATS